MPSGYQQRPSVDALSESAFERIKADKAFDLRQHGN